MLRLQLFGGVAWTSGDQSSAVQGRTRTDVLLTLVAHHGSPVSVEHLLDRLWTERPKSAANAVQRHIAALRRQLGQLVSDPTTVIESVAGGYRLAPTVITDSTADLTADAPATTTAEVTWWEQALLGADTEHHAILHAHLQRLATEALTSWQARPEVAPDMVRERVRHMLAHSPGNPTMITLLNEVAGKARKSDPAIITADGRELVRSCVCAWVAGDTERALDLLDSAESLPEDFARRICRWMIWIDPNEPWARYTFSLIVRGSIIDPATHERVAVAVDARCFAMMDNGRDVAARETAAAASLEPRLRRLRVEFILGLASPHDDRQDAIITALTGIDHPDAIVESLRFRFLSSLRTGQYEQAQRELVEYERMVGLMWPIAGDDFAPMARVALQRSVDKRVADVFGEPAPSLGAFRDDKLIPLANAIRQLIRNAPDEPLADVNFSEAVSCATPSAGEAMYVLRDLNESRPVLDRAADLAATLPDATRDGHFPMAPIALTLVAEATGDRGIASAAREALEPWSGQVLGLWPMDFVFGPADDWIARL